MKNLTRPRRLIYLLHPVRLCRHEPQKLYSGTPTNYASGAKLPLQPMLFDAEEGGHRLSRL